MEVGCTCRSVTSDDARGVLDAQVQVVLLEVPPAEARADAGSARLRRLAPWRGPVVLTSAAVINPLPEGAGAAVTKPYFVEDLVAAIELARQRSRPSSLSVRAVAIADPVEPVARRDLDANVVRAMLVRTDGPIGRGRVRTMSYEGGLAVAMNQPLRRGADVAVELTLPDGRRMEIEGRVASSSITEMEIELALDEDGERGFLRQFLDQARDVTQPFVEQVRNPPARRARVIVLEATQLDKLWAEAIGDLDDDPLQQRFIQVCIKAQKLEHAVKCYRQLKQDRPEDERASKILSSRWAPSSASTPSRRRCLPGTTRRSRSSSRSRAVSSSLRR